MVVIVASPTMATTQEKASAKHKQTGPKGMHPIRALLGIEEVLRIYYKINVEAAATSRRPPDKILRQRVDLGGCSRAPTVGRSACGVCIRVGAFQAHSSNACCPRLQTPPGLKYRFTYVSKFQRKAPNPLRVAGNFAATSRSRRMPGLTSL